MLTIDLSLNGLLEGNFFNFLFLFLLIVVLLTKIGVLYKIDFAREKIIEKITKSDEDKYLSEEGLEEAKKEVENLPQEIAKIKAETQNTIESYNKSIQADLEKTEQKLQKTAQKILDNEVLRINASLQRELALDSIEKAHQKTLENLKNNEHLHRKFILEAIQKIEEIEI